MNILQFLTSGYGFIVFAVIIIAAIIFIRPHAHPYKRPHFTPQELELKRAVARRYEPEYRRNRERFSK